MAKTRVLVVGMGSIGTVCAYALEHGGLAEVTAVMRSTYDRTIERGIDMNSVDFGKGIRGWRPTTVVKSVPDISRKDAMPFDFILVATKNIPDVPPSMVDVIEPAIVPGETAIILAQNGVNIEKPLAARFPTNPLLSNVVFTGSSIRADRTIEHRDPDMQRIGPFVGQGPSAEAAARHYVSVYNPHGTLDVIYHADVAEMRWRKLAFNASFNVVGTVVQMDTSRIRMCQSMVDELIVPVVLEIRAVAAAQGIILQEPADLVRSVMEQDDAYAFFRPSMLQDYEKGNLMEIETIAGEPLREGKRMGVPMPTLSMLYQLLLGLQTKVKESKGLWEPKYNEGVYWRL